MTPSSDLLCAPGELRLTPSEPSMDWPTKNAAKLATVPITKATTPNTAALAAGDDVRAERSDGELGEQDAGEARQDRIEAGAEGRALGRAERGGETVRIFAHSERSRLDRTAG